MLDLPPVKMPGANIPDKQRHTVKLTVRAAPELAERIREVCASHNLTLADIMALGVATLETKKET